MKRPVLIALTLLAFFVNAYSQQLFESSIPFEKDEYWWGGVVAYGSQMPYLKPAVKEFYLEKQ